MAQYYQTQQWQMLSVVLVLTNTTVTIAAVKHPLVEN